MPDTVSQGSSPGSPLTWATYSTAWNAAGATTWATATAGTNYTVSVSSTIGIVDAPLNSISKAINEAFGLTDSQSRTWTALLPILEAFSTSDSFDRVGNFSRDLAETISFSDSLSSIATYLRSIGELIGVADGVSQAANFVRNLDESLAIAELYTGVAAYSRNLAEQVSIADAAGKDIGKLITEAISAADTISNAVSMSLSEAIAIIESESAGVGKEFAESFTLSDVAAMAFTKAVAESMNVGEAMGRVVAFNAAISEGFSVTDAASKAIRISKDEALTIVDLYRRQAAAVISDILVGTGDITDEDFAALLAQAQPAGYGPFADFMEGEHEYQSAIFRAIMTADSNVKPRLMALEVTADVPDVHDQGTASVTTSGVSVAFSRQFYEPPEVKLGLKGGAGFAVPRVTGITKEGFTAEIVNASNVRVAGTITWAAHGY